MKKALSLLLCLALLCAPLPARAAGGAPSWASDAYADLQSHGLLPAQAQTAGEITRGSFAGLLADAVQAVLPAEALAEHPPVDAGYFADGVSDPSLLAAAAYGILEGTLSGGARYADADSPLTREQAAKMVCSALDFSGSLGYQASPAGQAAQYTDAGSISSWAAPYTGQVAAYSIMVGDQAGNFNPAASLDWPSAVVILSRTLGLLEQAASGLSVLPLDSALDWSGADSFGRGDRSVSRPLTGYVKGYYIIDNGDGTVSGLSAPISGQAGGQFSVERYDAQGAVTSTKTLPMELPILGTVFSGAEYNYVAFGQMNSSGSDSQEVWRIVQYDKDWNRLGAVSLTGGDTYTTEPFRSAVPRMAESADGQTVTLYAARTRYDGHQSNITFVMNAQPFSLRTCMGEEFPSNHVSHSFGQFIQYDGSQMVTVDHGDAYPRSFVLQAGGSSIDLLDIYGETGDNVTNAIGSGFEVSDSGYLFLGCSDPQQGGGTEPWNVFLAYTGRDSRSPQLTWLTDSSATINCARLVKVDGDTFVALWGQDDGVHLQVLDGQGDRVGAEQSLPGLTMPPTQPVVQDGSIRWIQLDSQTGSTCLYTLTIA